jgi:hypothetical protein
MNLNKIISFVFAQVLLLCVILFSTNQIVSSQQDKLATNTIVRSVIEEALKKLGDSTVGIIAQGS